MGDDLLTVAEKLWNGEVSPLEAHPWFQESKLLDFGNDVSFIPSFANVTAVSTADGLVLVDTGSAPLARQVHGIIRTWKTDRLNTAVYSHGHIDHVFGVPVFEEEGKNMGWPNPVVVAHKDMPARFDRYIRTAGYNSIINQRQFQLPEFKWPTVYRYPDTTYDLDLTLTIGDERVELYHARGETDDHTFTWFPKKRVLCTGDLFIWASPNAGNPQKVQRYACEWAQALRKMTTLGPNPPEILLPGHGVPIVGKERIQQALTDVAEYLESLLDQTLELMNQGAKLNEILHSVSPPQNLLDKPYLQPVYDEPEFIIRNIYRQYGGWWDGNPSSLKPPKEVKISHELAELAGGAKKLAQRAMDLLNEADVLDNNNLFSGGTQVDETFNWNRRKLLCST